MVGSPGGRFCTIPRASQAPLEVLHGGCTSPTGARQPPTALADGAVAMAAGSVLGGIRLADRRNTPRETGLAGAKTAALDAGGRELGRDIRASSAQVDTSLGEGNPMEPVTLATLQAFLQRLGERYPGTGDFYLLGGSALCLRRVHPLATTGPRTAADGRALWATGCLHLRLV